MIKKILRYEITLWVLSWIIACYMKLIFYTTRWVKYNWEVMEAYTKNQKPFIACFWHNRLLMQIFFWTSKEPFHMMISSHHDGKLIAKTIGRFNVSTISGSSSKKGAYALRQTVRVLKKGEYAGITPDGPRGPRFVVKPGIVQIAKLAGVDIIPCAYSTSRRKVLSTWDRFILAFPFGRGAMVFGNPIPCSFSTEEFEEVRLKVEEGLLQVSDKADEICGHLPLR